MILAVKYVPAMYATVWALVPPVSRTDLSECYRIRTMWEY